MEKVAKAGGLGKGLAALIQMEVEEEQAAVQAAGSGAEEVPVEKITAGVFQPRHHFDDAAIRELADSVRQHGIMQPILLRRISGGRYEIIAGERRWRAAKMAGLGTVPALVREITDAQALELALIENIQRQDLSPLEEAQGFARLMDEFGYTQEELSGVIGKSRSHIANILRLLTLPEEIRDLVAEGKLSAGHARPLVNHPQALEIARQVVARGLSVRQTELLAKRGPSKEKAPSAKPGGGVTRAGSGYRVGEKDSDILALEEALTSNLGMEVRIEDRGDRTGEVVIAYASLEGLDEILRRLGGGA